MEGLCVRKIYNLRLKLACLFVLLSCGVIYIFFLCPHCHSNMNSDTYKQVKTKLLIPKLSNNVEFNQKNVGDDIKISQSISVKKIDIQSKSSVKYNRHVNGTHVIDMNKDVQIFGEEDKKKTSDEKQRLPGCIIIGVKKAGTGAIVQYLKMHPQIVIGDYELNFFDYPETFQKGFEFYRKMMPFSKEGQITMEKTSNYFHHKESEKRIKMMNSTIKLLLLVREPISRAMSDYLQRTLKDKVNKAPPFEDFVIDENGQLDETYVGLRPSLYYKHLKRWLKSFPMSQIHIIEADEFVTNPYNEVKKVETFLGLPHLISKDRFVFNEKKGFYCMKVDNGTEEREEKCLSKGKGRKHPNIDPDVVRKLEAYFKPKNEMFFNLIGRRFDW